MKREELKTRMDQIPHDFDQEALWNKINPAQEDKKSNKWIFLLLGFIVVLCGTLLLWNITKSGNMSEQSISNTTQTPSKIETINIANLNQKREANTTANSNNKSQTIKSIDSKTNNSLKTNNNDSNKIKTNPNNTKHSKSSLEKGSILANNQQNNTTNFDFLPLGHLEHKSSKTYTKNNQSTSYLYTNSNKNNTKTANLNRALINDCKPLPQLSTLLSQTNNTIVIAANKTSTSNKNNLQNSLSLSIGLGYDNHQFSDNVYGDIRDLFESGMTSISLGVNYNRRLNKSFFVAAGVTFTQSQMKLSKTEKSSTLTYIREENPLATWEATNYKYFNQYYRLDVEIGLGYIYHLSSSWTINPLIGVGYNTYSTQRGDILSTKLQFVDLHKVSGYKKSTAFYSSFSLKTEKTWKNQYVFGLQLGVQTKRSLLQTAKYTHTITPMKSTIYVSKLF